MNDSSSYRSMYPGFAQVAYVTTDLDEAKDRFAKGYGVEKWFSASGFTFPMASGEDVVIDLALAYLGDTQFELIKPVSGDAAMYRSMLANDGSFEMVFHHLCKCFDTEEQFRDNLAWLKGKNIPLPMDNSDLPPNGMAYACYADFRDTLGHYLEYVWFMGDGREWSAQIPQNG